MAATSANLAAKVIELLMGRPDFVELLANAIFDSLTATTPVYDKGAQAWTDRADYKARLEAAKLALAYGEGLPLQRIMQQTLLETRGDLHDALRESPELLKAVEREVEKAKFRRRNARNVTPGPAEIEVPS